MKKIFFFLPIFLQFALAQPIFTPAAARLKGTEIRKNLHQNAPVQLSFRNIGPTIMGGRVVDVDANPNNSNEFYVAYASGGLWKTINNGNSFTPLFDHEAVMTIGDIAVDWANGEKIWIGTGECNSSRSSYSGAGIFVSEDKGKTWQQSGLAETHHIGRVVLHPKDENVAFVAAIGHLYSPNAERGIFKTQDGGKTWQQTLFVNDTTGAIDLIIDNRNPSVLYACMWERTRAAWNFDGKGTGSAIYKSTDTGETWEKISTPESGLPQGNVGRMGIAISYSQSNILYTIIDNQNNRPASEQKKNKPKYVKKDFKTMAKKDFLAISENDLNSFLDFYDFPAEYSAAVLKEKITKDEIQVSAIYDFLDDANNDLFDTPIVGCEVYKSEDAGKTWHKTHDGYLDNVFYTYGYYFAQIRVSPFDDKEIYILGVPALRSEDGGKIFRRLNKEHIHPDHHALWLDPKIEGHFLLGNDGGLDMTYDKGETFTKLNRLPVGQFYAVNVDSATPYNVYGGLQDNGVWTGPSTNTPNEAWHATGRYPFREIISGDGMQVMIDGRDNKTLYSGYQFGNYYRFNAEANEEKYITPSHTLGDKPYRFNWQSPILLSVHNQDIMYMGAQKVLRSMDKGEHFTAISPDLTKHEQSGNVPYATITALAESNFQFGLLYAGTDDGKIHVSKDAGTTWQDISANLPQDFWVSRIIASHFQKEKVYVTLNGYRWDNFEAMVYVSEDYGKIWTRIGTDLPLEPVNVIKEDSHNPKLLYVGTDNGLYASFDAGKTFFSLNNQSLPNVSVHDLVVHPKAKELVVGTHGRSIYIADVSVLQALTENIRAKEMHFFPIDSLNYRKSWGQKGFDWTTNDTPSIAISFWQKNAQATTIRILNEKGLEVYKTQLPVKKGLITWNYDLSANVSLKSALAENISDADLKKDFDVADNGKLYLPPGKYRVFVSNSKGVEEGILKVKAAKKKGKRG